MHLLAVIHVASPLAAAPSTFLTVLHVSPALAAMLATAVLIPAVSALIARQHWDQSITGLLTLLLSAISGFCTEWANAGSGFRVGPAVLASAGAFIIAAVSQSRILASTGLYSWLLAVGTRMKDTGIAEGGGFDPTAGLDYNEPDPGDVAVDAPASSHAATDAQQTPDVQRADAPPADAQPATTSAPAASTAPTTS